MKKSLLMAALASAAVGLSFGGDKPSVSTFTDKRDRWWAGQAVPHHAVPLSAPDSKQTQVSTLRLIPTGIWDCGVRETFLMVFSILKKFLLFCAECFIFIDIRLKSIF